MRVLLFVVEMLTEKRSSTMMDKKNL